MSRTKAAIAAAAAFFVVAAMAGACRSPTQITVQVTASGDGVCQPQLQTAISVGTTGSYEERAPASTAAGCAPGGSVGSLVVIPTGDEGEDVAIRVVGSIDGSPCDAPAYGPSCIVARRALHFIPNESLTLVVDLGADCENVPCDAFTTCVDKTCRGATIGDPSQCANGSGCGEGSLGPAEDAGTSATDAGIADSTVNDAPVTDANDGGDTSTIDGGTDAGSDASPDATSGIVLAVGDQFVCVKRPSGIVACWGNNANGELGFFPSDGGDAGYEWLPRDVPALGSPLALSAGTGYGCELLQGGVVKCWGDNANGALGLPEAGIYPPTTLVTGSAGMCAGAYESCTIDADGGTVRCWAGHSDDGVPVNGVSSAVQLACGSDVECVRIGDGTVRCWDGNGLGDLGVPDGGDVGLDSVEPAVTGVVDLAMSYHHACAALSDGGVRCWGSNDDLESDPSYADANAPRPGVFTPTLVAGVSDAKHVAVGLAHSCALLVDGGVTCWGDNHGEQVGSDPCGFTCGATPVPTLPHALQIAAGVNETCAVIDDGGVWCWGTNYTGELGRGTTGASGLPAPAHL